MARPALAGLATSIPDGVTTLPVGVCGYDAAQFRAAYRLYVHVIEREHAGPLSREPVLTFCLTEGQARPSWLASVLQAVGQRSDVAL